jgi:hypothetical protein
MDATVSLRDDLRPDSGGYAMTQLETAKRTVEQLSIDEIANLRRWLAAFEAALWDQELNAELIEASGATATATRCSTSLYD